MQADSSNLLDVPQCDPIVPLHLVSPSTQGAASLIDPAVCIPPQATLVMEEVPPLPGSELSPARARQSMVLEARRSMMLESRSKSRLMPESRKSMVVGAHAQSHTAALMTSIATRGLSLHRADP